MDFDITIDSDISDNWEESIGTHQAVEHRIDENEETEEVQWNHEYAPFKNVFIKIASLNGLVGCQLQQIFMVIRVKKGVPVIKTTNYWCAGEVIDVDCGYSLDFSMVPEFELREFTPVIEVHRKNQKRADLIGLCLLPLRVMSIEVSKGKDVTFFYRNSVVPLRNLQNGGTVGTITLTIAFGFPEHASLFESTYRLTQEREENLAAAAQQQHQLEEIKRRKRKERRRQQRKRARETRWQKMAIAMGWKPPGFVADGWKKKARKQGWNPPRQIVYSSIQVSCNWFDVAPRTEASVQTQFVPHQPQELLQDVLEEIPSSIPEDDDEDLMNLIGLLNKNNKKQPKREYVLVSPSCLVDLDATKAMSCSLVSNGVIFECEQKDCPKEDSSMLSEIEQSIQELAQTVSKDNPVSKILLSESDSDPVPEEPSFIKPLQDMPVECPSICDSSEDEDENEQLSSSELSDTWDNMRNIDPEIQNYLRILKDL